MRRIAVSGYLVLLTILLSSSAFAFPHGHMMSGKEWWNNADYVKQLDLTKDQISKIKEIDKSYEGKFNTIHDGVMKSYKDYKAVMSDPKASDAQITAKHNTMMDEMNALKNLELERKLKIRDVLNEKQRAKLAEIKKMKWEGSCDHDKKQCDSSCTDSCDHHNYSGGCNQKSK